MKTPDELMFLKNKNALQHESEASMKGKTCVITGATSGVGLEAVRALAKGQATIVMVVRNLAKGEEVKKELVDLFGVSVDIVVADFSRLEDVRNAAKQALALTNKIDVLINCAGLHSTKATYTSEGRETVFCVNHLASFLFTELLLTRLKESAPSRILQINSEGHRFNGLDIDDLDWKKRHYTGLRGYGASKTAQLLTMWEINDRLKDTGVTINAMHPGDVKTHIGSNNGFLYRMFSKFVIQPSLRDPIISGKAIYYLVADPALRNVSGKFYHLTIEETPAKHALDRELGKRVYEESLRLTGLSREEVSA
ncbi:MAG: SDR family NAD(P)-dependent oxidoreductase [Erysipelotrichaceae bacterium]|nr:SDR family NAD(P)-dependent oxidoreductase [Erysipelotrichaceae bacterium]